MCKFAVQSAKILALRAQPQALRSSSEALRTSPSALRPPHFALRASFEASRTLSSTADHGKKKAPPATGGASWRSSGKVVLVPEAQGHEDEDRDEADDDHDA